MGAGVAVPRRGAAAGGVRAPGGGRAAAGRPRALGPARPSGGRHRPERPQARPGQGSGFNSTGCAVQSVNIRFAVRDQNQIIDRVCDRVRALLRHRCACMVIFVLCEMWLPYSTSIACLHPCGKTRVFTSRRACSVRSMPASELLIEPLPAHVMFWIDAGACAWRGAPSSVGTTAPALRLRALCRYSRQRQSWHAAAAVRLPFRG